MSDKKPLILIADDEEDIKMILAMYLENNGFEVITAFDGLSAVEQAKENKPDAILMDIMMPIIDGIEVTKQLKNLAETKDIPVVMLSAAAQSDKMEKAMKAGASDYISKPFEPDEVMQILNRVLKKA